MVDEVIPPRRGGLSRRAFSGAALAAIAAARLAGDAARGADGAAPLTMAAVLDATLKPYDGPSVRGVDVSTLTKKVMCGYQGWFNCAGDGAERGWVHWTKRGDAPPGDGNTKVDLWPDVSEVGTDELFATDLKRADGTPAMAFSSYREPTVLRHFRWMRDYGIDGAFVQRFISARDPRVTRHNNVVLGHCRAGANQCGRAYAVMYDLSGQRAGGTTDVIEDWRLLRTRMKIGDDPAYLRHRGKPLVAVWGIGFSDGRKYTLAECAELVEFLKNDKEAGGCAVMLGVPSYWREMKADAVKDPLLHQIIAKADVVSPWTVGRYRSPEEAERHADKVWAPDLAWCRERKVDYLPVVFPGFSWHNMYGEKQGKAAPLNAIPRLGGRFLWAQYHAAMRVGCDMVYQAMFDEVDEGTAIFKCTNQPPATAATPFVTYDGLPSDFYLQLLGQASRMLRREILLTSDLPKLKP